MSKNTSRRHSGTDVWINSWKFLCRGFSIRQPAGNLGAIVVDLYGNAPLTALVELDSHVISDVKVTVHGKGEKGVPVTYTVCKESLATYDGVPIFGLYQKFANKVTVEYKENGKAMKDDYVVQTSAIVNHYMDNRSVSDLQQTKVIKVAPGFKDRLYLVNTHTFTAQGAEFHWHGEKDKNAGILDAGPAGGHYPLTLPPSPLSSIRKVNIVGGWIKIPFTMAMTWISISAVT
ncbi:aryl-sulfate sulfotransferase N-terminal domain-containing protein [Citrobacter meridianamericanus]|uniref:aryl-sulfate sulfotransferase N-terminal domain-containing protein n=1 Tax=Citrobacter meridianamericanus TaxID=2894201 RepID=UPI00356B68E7